MRARVPAVVSPGSSPGAKKPCATISWLGTGADDWWKSRTTNSATWSRGVAVVEVHAEEPRRRVELDIALFTQLAGKRLGDGLASLHATARQMPSRSHSCA